MMRVEIRVPCDPRRGWRCIAPSEHSARFSVPSEVKMRGTLLLTTQLSVIADVVDTVMGPS